MCPHAFLTITRYHLKSPNYKYFYHFDFEDYLQRSRVIRTYDIRYLDMTRGKSRDTFGLKDPPEWELGEEMVVSNSKAKRAKRTTISPASTPSGWFLLYGITCVLMFYCMCPYTVGMCPYAWFRVSLCLIACVPIQFRWWSMTVKPRSGWRCLVLRVCLMFPRYVTV